MGSEPHLIWRLRWAHARDKVGRWWAALSLGICFAGHSASMMRPGDALCRKVLLVQSLTCGIFERFNVVHVPGLTICCNLPADPTVVNRGEAMQSGILLRRCGRYSWPRARLLFTSTNGDPHCGS
jgi:hypothetical protein